jgi:hypothetical protein
VGQAGATWARPLAGPSRCMTSSLGPSRPGTMWKGSSPEPHPPLGCQRRFLPIPSVTPLTIRNACTTFSSGLIIRALAGMERCPRVGSATPVAALAGRRVGSRRCLCFEIRVRRDPSCALPERGLRTGADPIGQREDRHVQEVHNARAGPVFLAVESRIAPPDRMPSAGTTTCTDGRFDPWALGRTRIGNRAFSGLPLERRRAVHSLRSRSPRACASRGAA